MHIGSTRTINRFQITGKRRIWMSAVVCLIVLISSLAAGCDDPLALAASDWPAEEGLPACLAGTTESTDTTILTAGATNAALGEGLLFSSPVETETPDVEPAMPKDSKVFTVTIPHAAMMPKSFAVLKGAFIPLYLTHQSLLC